MYSQIPQPQDAESDTFHSSQTDSLVEAAETDVALSRSIKEMSVINQNTLIQLDLPKADIWTNTPKCTQGQLQHVGKRSRIRTHSFRHMGTDQCTYIQTIQTKN